MVVSTRERRKGGLRGQTKVPERVRQKTIAGYDVIDRACLLLLPKQVSVAAGHPFLDFEFKGPGHDLANQLGAFIGRPGNQDAVRHASLKADFGWLEDGIP